MAIQKPKVFWPFIITLGVNDTIIIYDGATSWSMVIAPDTYFSAVLLAAAIETAVQGHFSGMTVTVSATGYFHFEWNAPFRLKFGTTPTIQPYDTLGFIANDSASAPTGVGFNEACDAIYQHKNGWYSPVAVLDDSIPVRNRDMDTVTRAMGGQTKFITETELVDRMVTFAWLRPEKFLIAFATSQYKNQALEQWWQDGRARFRYWQDGTQEATYVDYVLDMKTIPKWKPARQFRRVAYYQIELGFWGYVA